MQQTVGTTAVLLGGTPTSLGGASVPALVRPMIQNLGAGDLYVGFDDAVTAANGLKLAVGEALTLTGAARAVYVVASAASTDVRLLDLG